MRDRLVIHQPDVVLGGDHARQFQIVVRLEVSPHSARTLADGEFDPGPSPKAVSAEFPAACVQHPVGLKPVQHVVVAAQQHHALPALAPSLGKRSRADLGNLPVHHAAELIHDRRCPPAAPRPAWRGQHGSAPHCSAPHRDATTQAQTRSPADRRRRGRVEVASRQHAVNHRPGWPLRLVERPQSLAQARLPDPDGPTITPICQARPSRANQHPARSGTLLGIEQALHPFRAIRAEVRRSYVEWPLS